MELRQQVARGLRRRQIVTQEQHQRLVLAKLIRSSGRSPPAGDIANRLSTISEALRPRLRLFSLISRSITAAVRV